MMYYVTLNARGGAVDMAAVDTQPHGYGLTTGR